MGGYEWYRAYIDDIYTEEIHYYQGHDDIALIRQMRPQKDNLEKVDKASIPTLILERKRQGEPTRGLRF